MAQAYQHYYAVGPYIKEKSEIEIINAAPPDFLRAAFAELSHFGIECHYGQWQIKGEPNVILIDFQGYLGKRNEIKRKLWDLYKVDSINSDWDYDEPLVWAFCAGLLVERIATKLPGPIVVQAHEWLAGAALLQLRAANASVRTVFTTHATTLGRSLAGTGSALYENISGYDPYREAQRLNVIAKHTLERASAQQADIFTTVSDITGLEAEHFLGRKPDVLVPNGLDLDKFPTFEETSVKHIQNREKVREFLTYHFFPYYSFDLEHTLQFFILGRYEWHNKGIDVMMRALKELNERLRKDLPDRTIAVFIFIMRPHRGIKLELFENKNYYRHIKGAVEWNAKEILKRLVYDFVSGSKNPSESVFTKEFLQEMHRDIHKFKRTGNPLVVTHNLENEYDDIIVRSCYDSGLDNREDDRVKLIFYPAMLDGNDGLLDMQLYDVISGCHLGLFPSYYEPWGYTPLEAAAMGVPALTTDLSGFGQYMKPFLTQGKGIYVVDRYQKSDDYVVKELVDEMFDFAKLDHAERVELKIAAKTLSQLCDWRHFIKNYITAHNMAVEKPRA
jgi:glycogen(starch) synthase